MASGAPESPTLDPQLYEHWDDEDDFRDKAPLKALIEGSQTPQQAAQAIDKMVRASTGERMQKITDYMNSHSMTAEDYESDEWEALGNPNATGHALVLLQTYSRICTAYSPYSEGQNRLIQLLEALRDLPRWDAPECRPDADGKTFERKFWAFEHGWLGLEDEFRARLGGK